MDKSDDIKDLALALLAAQTEVKNPTLDATNPHFSSKFVSLAGVRAAVIPAFNNNGISVVQWLGGDDFGLSCETVLIHSTGQWLSSTFHIPVSKKDSQGYGSAATYARRYSLQAVAGVVGDVDDDGNEASKEPKHTPTAGAFESLPTDLQTWVQDTATELGSMCVSGDIKGAVDHLQYQKLDAETKTALWSLLDSKHRSAIKKQIKENDVVSQ